jgi:hypothetical protein
MHYAQSSAQGVITSRGVGFFSSAHMFFEHIQHCLPARVLRALGEFSILFTFDLSHLSLPLAFGDHTISSAASLYSISYESPWVGDGFCFSCSLACSFFSNNAEGL